MFIIFSSKSLNPKAGTFLCSKFLFIIFPYRKYVCRLLKDQVDNGLCTQQLMLGHSKAASPKLKSSMLVAETQVLEQSHAACQEARSGTYNRGWHAGTSVWDVGILNNHSNTRPNICPEWLILLNLKVSLSFVENCVENSLWHLFLTRVSLKQSLLPFVLFWRTPGQTCMSCSSLNWWWSCFPKLFYHRTQCL